MNVVGKVGSLISQGVYSVATPFHPFGGAVDIIVVEQEDGTYRSTPWYVRFGKFQGVLKGAEKIVRISVNGIEAGFHMYLDNSGEAYFVREVVSNKDNGTDQVLNNSDISEVTQDDNVINGSNHRNENGVPSVDEDIKFLNGCVPLGTDQIGNGEAVNEQNLYEFQDTQSQVSPGSPGDGSYHYGSLEHMEDLVKSQSSDSGVVLVSVDGHILTAPISSCEENTYNVQLSTPQFHLGPGEGSEVTIEQLQDDVNVSMSRKEVFQSCLALSDLAFEIENEDTQAACSPSTGLAANVSTHDSQNSPSSHRSMEEAQGGRDLKFENGARVPLPNSYSPCNSGSPTSTIQVDSETNASIKGNTEYMSSDGASVHSVSNDLEQENGLLPAVHGPQGPSQIRHAFEDEFNKPSTPERFEISLCGNLLRAGMGLGSADEVFNAHRITKEEFIVSRESIIKNESLIVRFKERYLPWDKAAPIILGMAAFGLHLPAEPKDDIPVEQDETPKIREDNPGLSSTPSGRRWRLWPIPFRRVKSLQHTNSNCSSEEVFVDSESCLQSPNAEPTSTANGDNESPRKQFLRTNLPTSEQIASLNLKDGQNMIAFIFSTRVLGKQQVDAHVYLWKWNARIVISDVDGTITKSDVLGQFMPLVGKDWTQSGVARLFSAIKENGYQLLFLSARAIVQAYLTRSFLLNLKQDGKALPNGPVVISPDGLFPSLYREVIRRAPHEFKIACLEDIRALFPSDYNPFYAGFGNRETDEISYRKMGIPKGKILIINPKGEVAINHCVDVKSYTSLHTLVNDMFPPTRLAEHEEFNSWNYWKVPLPNIDC
ncbi:lipin family protein [Tasmannia lanceolata]|uniref:lipin family protein n=1 Tax=Tasmannia lanceolata TaxID=3420 RepID=UPI004062AB03